ncbi:MAG TPA: hypothetical protein VK154_06780 [Chitinophagales bacterium]|nr:hypothetical protein [Chitinophagales bacterium]
MASLFFFNRWNRSSILAGGDAWGYYSYLPATFIHHDLDNLKGSLTARFHNDYNRTFDTTQAFITAELSYPKDGRTPVIKYTYGVAFFQTPFFLIAHWLAPRLNYEADGYSQIYIILIHTSLVFYCILGLWILRRFLLEYYSDTVTTVILLVLAAGTNLYYFVVESTPMSHVYLFCLFSILLYSTQQFYKNFHWVYVLIIGLCGGMITLIRPNEIICLVIPLFYGVTSWGDLKNRFQLFFRLWKRMALALFAFLAPIIPLLLYWKTMSGKWLYFSYPNETFDFLHPHLLGGIFSFKNGWLTYTPIMFLAIAGIPILFKKSKLWILPFALFIPQHIYVIYSWWCWYYINGFGSRPMVETYPLWAIPLGAFLAFAGRRMVTLVITGIVVLFCIALNIFQTWQMAENLLLSEFGNYTFVKNTLFKPYLTEKDQIEYDNGIEQPTGLIWQAELYRETFEDSLNENYVRSVKDSGQFSYRVTGNPSYLIDYHQTATEANLHKGDWIKVSVWCRSNRGVNLLGSTSVVVQFVHNNKAYAYKILRLQNKVLKHRTIHPYIPDNPSGGYAHYFVPVLNDIKPDDMLKVFISTSDNEIYIDDFVIERWR